MVEVESQRNLAGLEAKAEGAQRNPAARALEECPVEIRGCRLCREPIQTKLHNRPSEAKIVLRNRLALHIGHQNLEERNRSAQWSHR